MIFGTFCAVMTFHVFLFYPETAGKSLEEIDVVFEGNVPAWRSAHVGGTFQDRVEAAKERRRDPNGIVAGEKGQTDERDAQKTSGEARDAAHHEEV